MHLEIVEETQQYAKPVEPYDVDCDLLRSLDLEPFEAWDSDPIFIGAVEGDEIHVLVSVVCLNGVYEGSSKQFWIFDFEDTRYHQTFSLQTKAGFFTEFWHTMNLILHRRINLMDFESATNKPA